MIKSKKSKNQKNQSKSVIQNKNPVSTEVENEILYLYIKLTVIECVTSRLDAKRNDYITKNYAANDVPQPHVSVAFGLLNENPRLFRPSKKSISMPNK